MPPLFIGKMKHGLPFFLVLAMFAGSPALPQSKTPPGKPAARKTAPKTVSTTAKKTASSKKAKSSKRPAAAAAATSGNRQLGPTPDRYKEIQQALVDKGYLKSEPNGVWDAQSTDALLRFQTDNKLSPTGKLSSASLISLGLGPKTAATLPPSAEAAGDPPTTPEN
jgi:hypothetical protein